MQLQIIQKRIYEIRGSNVMLDYDLAELYETTTKRLKEAVRRNIDRFPDDFMFELNNQEFMGLRSQFATSNKGGTRYKPFAFTEQGVAMLSSVLNSPKAIEINIQIIRAFVFLRQYALTHKDLTEKLKEPESHFDKKFKDVYEAINYLLQKDTMKTEQIERKRIGYKTKE
jgi:phage regulator Rha-like protein